MSSVVGFLDQDKTRCACAACSHTRTTVTAYSAAAGKVAWKAQSACTTTGAAVSHRRSKYGSSDPREIVVAVGREPNAAGAAGESESSRSASAADAWNSRCRAMPRHRSHERPEG